MSHERLGVDNGWHVFGCIGFSQLPYLWKSQVSPTLSFKIEKTVQYGNGNSIFFPDSGFQLLMKSITGKIYEFILGLPAGTS